MHTALLPCSCACCVRLPRRRRSGCGEPGPELNNRFWNPGAREMVDIGAAAKGDGFGASSFHRAVCVHLRNNSLTWNEAPNQFPFATDTDH